MPETPHTVSDLMTLTVVAVSSNTPYKEIARTLAEWKVSALPVLAGEDRVLRSDEDIAEEVRQDVVARLFPHQRSTVEVQVNEGVVNVDLRVDAP